MTKPWIKIAINVGLITALVAILFEVASQLVIYRYIRLDYYLSAVAVLALVAGIIITRKRYADKAVAQAKTPDLIASLTLKERDILQQICEGKSNKEIAAINFVELSTIKTHINNLYSKLGVSNRKQAIDWYQKYVQNHKSTFSPPVEI